MVKPCRLSRGLLRLFTVVFVPALLRRHCLLPGSCSVCVSLSCWSLEHVYWPKPQPYWSLNARGPDHTTQHTLARSTHKHSPLLTLRNHKFSASSFRDAPLSLRGGEFIPLPGLNCRGNCLALSFTKNLLDCDLHFDSLIRSECRAFIVRGNLFLCFAVGDSRLLF